MIMPVDSFSIGSYFVRSFLSQQARGSAVTLLIEAWIDWAGGVANPRICRFLVAHGHQRQLMYAAVSDSAEVLDVFEKQKNGGLR